MHESCFDSDVFFDLTPKEQKRNNKLFGVFGLFQMKRIEKQKKNRFFSSSHSLFSFITLHVRAVLFVPMCDT